VQIAALFGSLTGTSFYLFSLPFQGRKAQESKETAEDKASKEDK
jgi:hypothetical protein